MSEIDTVLKFSVDRIELIDELNDTLFRKAKIKAFASGDNAHTLPIDEDVLKRGAKTIYNKPILWKYNKYLDDAMGHEKDEVPCGFIPKENNPVSFEKSSDGRIFIVINAYIWTRYCGKLLEIFKRDDNKKDVSVEIAVVDSIETDGKPKVLDFIIAGITILGEWINPACKGCSAELLAFSEDKKKYEDLMLSNGNIIIDNSFNSAVNSEWYNPRNKLFTPISNASNSRELFNEAYLVNSTKTDEDVIANHKYPHHVIKKRKLVLNKNGLEDAFKKVLQHGVINDDINKHLLNHYKELGLNSNNISEFNITEEQYNKYFSEGIKKESVGGKTLDINKAKELLCSYFKGFTFSKEDETVEKYSIDEVTEDKVICTDNEFGCKYEIGYSINENEEVTADMANMKKMTDENTEGVAQVEALKKEEEQQDEEAKESMSEDGTVKEEKDEEDHDEDKAEDKSEDEDKEENETEEMSFEDLKCKYDEMCSKFSELEEKNKAYMSDIEKMSDYEELKKFKEDTEAKNKQEAEMAEMNHIMSDIEKRGVKMSDEEKKEIMSKVKEFSSIDAWANFAKAQVFDKVENIDGVLKVGMPFAKNGNSHSGSIWDRI